METCDYDLFFSPFAAAFYLTSFGHLKTGFLK